MRRKINDKISKLDDTDLPELTAKQRDFVKGILDGLSAAESYRAAYDCSKMAPNTIWVEASRQQRNPKIALWLSAARQAGLGHTRYTLDQHLRRLDRLSELCVVSGNMGAAVQAEQLIGKASGHYTEQFRDMTADPVTLLRELATISPDLAAQLAKENDIPFNVTEH